MSFDSDFTSAEREMLLELIHESLRFKTHYELFIWLQGRVQFFMPHEILIAAWGDFSLGLIYFDILSSIPGVRTSSFTQNELSPLLKLLFSHWVNNKTPLTMHNNAGFFNALNLEFQGTCHDINNMKSSVIHGIQDSRGHHDSLFILMHSEPIPTASGRMLEALLPYIDCALRRLQHLPEQLPEATLETEQGFNPEIDSMLSSREQEIMHWVKEGKTNLEIGMILDISAFTVKNHLQRIFKKLDVINRAQAVSAYKVKFQEE